MRRPRTRVISAFLLLLGLALNPTSASADLNAVEYAGFGNPNSMAVNADGSLIAKANSSGVQISRDFGATWTQTLSLATIYGQVAMSSNGQHLVAGGVASHDGQGGYQQGTYLYVSSDAGATWVQKTGSGIRAWNKLAISDDGTKILASVEGIVRTDSQGYPEIYNNGYIYYSSNSGASFNSTLQYPYSYNSNNFGSFTDVDMTDDSNTFFAASNVGLFRSTDSGANWTQVYSQEVREISASSDGSIVYGAAIAGINSSGVIKSTDGGATWGANVDVDLALKYAQVDPTYIATSANGKYVVMGQNNQYIYESRDYGAHFVKADVLDQYAFFNLKPDGIVMSATGRYVYLVDSFRGEVFKATNGANKPSAPTVTSVSASSVSLSWSAPGTNGSTISDYLIEYSSNSGSTWTNFSHTASTATSRTVTGLTKGTSYQFRVSGFTEFGAGEFSNAVTAIPSTIPETPTAVIGTSGNQVVYLYWSAPSNTGGLSITDYVIEYRAGAGSWTTFSHTASSNTSATITGLTNGTGYTFRVSAVNNVGTGPVSTVSASVTPKSTPGAPTSLAATSRNGEVVLTWTAPTDNGGDTLTSYLVQYSSNSGSTWSDVSRSASTRTSETITSLSNGTEYTFRVSAINAVGTGTASSTVTATPATTASAPGSLVVTPGNRQVSLAFTPGASGGSAITDYVVEYSSNAGSSWSTFAHSATSTSPIVVTGLTNYTAYIFRLTPVNGAGNGATSSASASATPRGTLASPALTRASVGTASGAAFTTQPQITLRDQYSETIVTDSSTAVTVTISAGGSLVGTTTMTAVAGIITFTDLGISGTAGTSYTITYTIAGFSAMSQNVTPSVGTATKLRVFRNSSGTQLGAAFTTQPIIRVVDSGNNFVSTYQSTTITATVNNSTCFTGAGDTATATSGSATYSNLSLTGASGTQCLITYSAANLTSTSETVTLLAGAAASINRLTRPDYGYYGRPFGQQPVYTITDMGGNVVTTDNTTVLTISTPNNSGSTILQETQTAVNGVVTFTDLGISGINAGTFTQIRVTASSFVYIYSDSIMMLKGDPVLSWSTLTKLSGDAPFTVTAPTSNAAGAFAYSSSNTGVATITGSTITVVGQGTTTLTATLTPTDTTNFNSGVSVTTTLSVSAGAANVTISLAGGVVTVAKGTPIAITASVNVTGKVSFYINGKPIGGCTARHTTSSVSCTWKPSIQGQSVTLSALLRPSSVNYTNARSNLLQVGVGKRTGRR